jgi:hypothetical protein
MAYFPNTSPRFPHGFPISVDPNYPDYPPLMEPEPETLPFNPYGPQPFMRPGFFPPANPPFQPGFTPAFGTNPHAMPVDPSWPKFPEWNNPPQPPMGQPPMGPPYGPISSPWDR